MYKQKISTTASCKRLRRLAHEGPDFVTAYSRGFGRSSGSLPLTADGATSLSSSCGSQTRNGGRSASIRIAERIMSIPLVRMTWDEPTNWATNPTVSEDNGCTPTAIMTCKLSTRARMLGGASTWSSPFTVVSTTGWAKAAKKIATSEKGSQLE